MSRNWPKLTKMQRRMMLDFRDSRHGDLYIGFGRLSLTAQRLVHEGFIQRGFADWYSITQRGKDYVRFGMRAKRQRPAERKESDGRT